MTENIELRRSEKMSPHKEGTIKKKFTFGVDSIILYKWQYYSINGCYLLRNWKIQTVYSWFFCYNFHECFIQKVIKNYIFLWIRFLPDKWKSWLSSWKSWENVTVQQKFPPTVETLCAFLYPSETKKTRHFKIDVSCCNWHYKY